MSELRDKLKKRRHSANEPGPAIADSGLVDITHADIKITSEKNNSGSSAMKKNDKRSKSNQGVKSGGVKSGQELIDHHQKSRRFLDGVEDVVAWMSTAVLGMISDAVDDFNPYDGEIRLGFQKCFRRLLTATAQKEERVVFFYEAIPGFTVMAVKKEGWGLDKEPSAAKNTPKNELSKKSSKIKVIKNTDQLISGDHAQASTEQIADPFEKERSEAIEALVGAYVQRTGNRVLAIEGSDLVLVLFPVSDLKKNLREMGFWCD